MARNGSTDKRAAAPAPTAAKPRKTTVAKPRKTAAGPGRKTAAPANKRPAQRRSGRAGTARRAEPGAVPDVATASAAGAMLADAQAVSNAADLLGDAADALRDRRRKDFESGAIDADEAFRSVSDETTLREQATKLFVQANSFVLAASETAQAELESAITDAQAKIARIAQFKQALKIFAGLISLAGAIVSGQPRAIIGAVQGLRDSTD